MNYGDQRSPQQDFLFNFSPVGLWVLLPYTCIRTCTCTCTNTSGGVSPAGAHFASPLYLCHYCARRTKWSCELERPSGVCCPTYTTAFVRLFDHRNQSLTHVYRVDPSIFLLILQKKCSNAPTLSCISSPSAHVTLFFIPLASTCFPPSSFPYPPLLSHPLIESLLFLPAGYFRGAGGGLPSSAARDADVTGAGKRGAARYVTSPHLTHRKPDLRMSRAITLGNTYVSISVKHACLAGYFQVVFTLFQSMIRSSDKRR